MTNKYFQLIDNHGDLIMDSQHKMWLVFYQVDNNLLDSTSIREINL